MTLEARLPLCDLCGRLVARTNPPVLVRLAWSPALLPGEQADDLLLAGEAVRDLERGIPVEGAPPGTVRHEVGVCASCLQDRLGVTLSQLAVGLRELLAPPVSPGPPPAQAPPPAAAIIDHALQDAAPRPARPPRAERRRQGKAVARQVAGSIGAVTPTRSQPSGKKQAGGATKHLAPDPPQP